MVEVGVLEVEVVEVGGVVEVIETRNELRKKMLIELDRDISQLVCWCP